MRSLDRQIIEAIDDGLEFDYLDNLKIYCGGGRLDMDDANFALDNYISFIETNDTYTSKYLSLVESTKYIAELCGAKFK